MNRFLDGSLDSVESPLSTVSLVSIAVFVGSPNANSSCLAGVLL